MPSSSARSAPPIAPIGLRYATFTRESLLGGAAGQWRADPACELAAHLGIVSVVRCEPLRTGVGRVRGGVVISLLVCDAEIEGGFSRARVKFAGAGKRGDGAIGPMIREGEIA